MNEWKALQFAEKIIFELDSEKITQSIQAIIGIYDKNYPYSFNLIISQMIYLSFVKQKDDFDTYLNIIKEIETLEETNKSSSKILDVFTQFLLHKNSQESYYLLETLVLQNLIDSSVLKNKKDPYFAHHMSKKDLNNLARYQIVKKFFENIDELSKDDWKLHKQLIQERGNTSNITKAIRNDNIQILQEISTQNNFDLNKIIELSLYEINSFVVNNKITLIDYAAFFGSVKCFKYLLMNGANVNNTGKYAIAGGNEEIIHLCEQNHSVFKDSYEIAIEFHRNDIFKYVYENKIEDIPKLEELGKKCVLYHNYEIFTFLQDEGMQITSDIINESAKIEIFISLNIFLEDNQPSKDILVFSCESRNIEVVQYVLTKEGIDVNAKDIYLFYLIFILIFWDFKIIFGNYLNYLIQHL